MSYQSRLKALTEWLCRDFTVFAWDSTTLYAPTGEEFVELVPNVPDFTLHGKIPEEARFETAVGAINAYERTLDDYLDTGIWDYDNKRGVVYWRIRPKLHSENGWHTIYSRLLVSNKSVDVEHLRKTTCFFDYLPKDADTVRGIK